VDKAEDAGFRRGFSGKTNSEMFGKVVIGGGAGAHGISVRARSFSASGNAK